MKKLVPILLIFGLLFVQISTPGIAQEVKYVSQERDLGWITTAESEGLVNLTNETNDTQGVYSGKIYVYNNWTSSIVCGASLPINLTIEHPPEFTPGENLTVNISVKSLPGYIFFNTSGYHELNLTINSNVSTSYGGQQLDLSMEMALLLMNSYDTSFHAEIDTPIGNVTKLIDAQMAHSNAMSLNMKININMQKPISTNISKELTVDSSIMINVSFDVIIVARTKIIGHVVATGTALSETINKTVNWTDEDIKSITLPIRPNASSTDTVDLSVELEYIVDEFYIMFNNITLITDIDKEKVSSRVGGVFNETPDYGYDWVTATMTEIIESILSEYSGTFPMNITSVGKPEPIEQHSKLGTSTKATDENSIKSESPYSEETLLSESISMKVVSIEPWYTRSETYIVVAAIVGCIAVIYVVVRKNKVK